jgi:hypothetical protein
MGLIVKLYTFTSGATIVASEHNSNFDVVYNEINGNLDNTNIKANAAIDSSKIGAITAASKVSGASMYNLQLIPNTSGVVPVANLSPFATFPVTPSSAPTTNYQVANKKYVDDESGAIPAQVGLGSWVDKSGSYGAQQAATDGFVVVYGRASVNGGDFQVNFYTDSASNPTTLRGRIYTNSNTTENYDTLTCPVKKGEYWKVVQGTSGGVYSVYWIPLGS